MCRAPFRYAPHAEHNEKITPFFVRGNFPAVFRKGERGISPRRFFCADRRKTLSAGTHIPRLRGI